MNCDACAYEIDLDRYNENKGLCHDCWEREYGTVEDSGLTPLGCGPDDSCVPYSPSES